MYACHMGYVVLLCFAWLGFFLHKQCEETCQQNSWQGVSGFKCIMSWFYQYQVWKQYGSLWHPDRPSWTNRPSEHRTLVALIPQQQLQSAAFPCTCCWHAHPVPEVTNVTKCTSIFYDILWYLYIISISRQCLIRFMLARGIPLNFSNSLKKKWRAIERNIKLTNCTPFLWKNKNKSINISPKWRLAGCHLCSDLLRCPGRQSSGSR